MTAVTQCLKDSHETVVHDKSKSAEEVNTEIHQRNGQYFVRCPDQFENLRCGDLTDSSQEKPAADAKGHRGMKRFIQVVEILRTKVFSDHNSRSDGQTAEKTDHQEDQRAGGAYGSQSIASEEISYDQGVCRVI